MAFVVYFVGTLATLAFLLSLIAYRFRYIQNAVLYIPQMPPDSRTNCPNPSASQGFNHYEILSIPTKDGITLRGYVVRPNAISEESRRKASSSSLGVGGNVLGGGGGGGGGGGASALVANNSSGSHVSVRSASQTQRELQNSHHHNSNNHNASSATSIAIPAPPPHHTNNNNDTDAVSPTGSDTPAIVNIPLPQPTTTSAAHSSSNFGDDQHRRRQQFDEVHSALHNRSPDTSDTEKGVIIYFHGNAGNVGHRLPIAYHLAKATQCAVVMVDYRGYGKSDDPPTAFTLLGGSYKRSEKNGSTNSSNNPATNPHSAFNSRTPRAPPSQLNLGGEGGDDGLGGGLDTAQIKQLLTESGARGVTEEGLQIDAQSVLDYVTNRNVSRYPHYRRWWDNYLQSQHNGAMSTATSTAAASSASSGALPASAPAPSSGFPHAHGKVFVMGTSLGGAVTSYIASEEGYKDLVSGVMLENTFMSISEMVDEIANKLFKRGGGVRNLRGANGSNTAPVGGSGGAGDQRMRNNNGNGNGARSTPTAQQQQPQQSSRTALQNIFQSAFTDGSCLNNTILFTCLRILKPLTLFIGWNSGERIANLATPILFLSGRRDEIVPASQMDRLFAAAKRTSWKHFQPFAKGMHNDLPSQENYFAVIGTFVKAVVSGEAMDPSGLETVRVTSSSSSAAAAATINTADSGTNSARGGRGEEQEEGDRDMSVIYASAGAQQQQQQQGNNSDYANPNHAAPKAPIVGNVSGQSRLLNR